jgi:Xaa-Pro aminopeptidase
VIEDAGYGPYFTHRLGHGLGMDGHEPPYLVRGNHAPIVEGNVFTVEPVNGRLMGVAECRIRGELTAKELDWLKENISGQASDGYVP